MPEPVWYYARGEVEKGPLSTAQIKALAAAGRIRPDDFVWKEGMDNWVPAGEVQELHPVDAAKGKERGKEGEREREVKPAEGEAPARDRPVRRQMLATLPRPLHSLFRPASRLALLLGVLTVILARGCDSLGDRYVARLQAIASSAESQFQVEWEQRRQALEDQRRDLQKKAQQSPADRQKLQDLGNQLSRLDEEMRAEEARLRDTRWRDLQAKADESSDGNRIWGFWREVLFQLGTLLLSLGLFAVAYSVEGPERWICLGVLAVIIYSIFTGSGGAGP
jgi:hypothetical protein